MLQKRYSPRLVSQFSPYYYQYQSLPVFFLVLFSVCCQRGGTSEAHQKAMFLLPLERQQHADKHDHLPGWAIMPEFERPESGKQVMDHVPRGSRLRALNRLLEYALAEGEDLGLVHLGKLLRAAALAVNDELDNVRVLFPKTANNTSQNHD